LRRKTSTKYSDSESVSQLNFEEISAPFTMEQRLC